MKIFLCTLTLAAILFGITACGNEKPQTSDQNQKQPSDQAAFPEISSFTPTACFFRYLGADTTWIRIKLNDDGTVIGTYEWIPFQKDGSRGVLSGKKEGDFLKVIYDYMIEGSRQREEKIFQWTEDQFAEAAGELMEAEDGTLKIKDPENLIFKLYLKTDCNKVTSKQ